MDSFNIPGFSRESLEGRLETPLRRLPFFILILLLTAIGTIFFLRAWNLQISRGDYFLSLAEENRLYSTPVVSPRGIVYDRFFKQLVSNEPSFKMVFRKDAFYGREADFKVLVSRLNSFLAGQDANLTFRLTENLSIKDVPAEVVLRDHITQEKILEFESLHRDFPGVFIEEEYRRRYLDNSLSHVIGYVGPVSRDDLKKNPNYGINDFLGKTGLELYYEEDLRGEYGEKIKELNTRGRVGQEKIIRPPKPGFGIITSIDLDLQRAAYGIMSKALRSYGKEKGALIIQDPRDGSILALASFPSYDSNLFISGNDRLDLDHVLQGRSQPLFNRAIAGEYPAGSTIKPLLAAAAIEKNIIDPKRKIYDPGYISLPNPYRPGEKSIFLDWRAHGWINMLEAIAYSANVYFYMIGGGYDDIKGLGVGQIKNYESLFGLGSALGIDLPGEKKGFLPDPLWKKEAKQYAHDSVWRVGDTYHISIGQGDMTVTPLQINSAISVIANGGVLWRPRLVTGIADEAKNLVRQTSPVLIRRNFLSQHALDIAREGMRLVVTGGTAPSLRDLPVEAAGKTGTAQTGVPGQSHAWFVGFAPYENPEVVITVLVEDGGEGSAVSVPIAKEILYYYFTRQQQSIFDKVD